MKYILAIATMLALVIPTKACDYGAAAFAFQTFYAAPIVAVQKVQVQKVVQVQQVQKVVQQKVVVQKVQKVQEVQKVQRVRQVTRIRSR